MKVGRCDLLLLDSNVDGQCAGGSGADLAPVRRRRRMRIRQELLLGVGGFRALKAMGITPGVLHLNEGHSGFAVFEAIRDRMEEEGIDFDTAASQIPREVVFTTHTPVPAGHDRFNADLIEEHLGPLRDELGISHENLMGFGRENPERPRRAVLHDGAGAEAVAARQRGFVAARRGFAGDVEGALSGTQPEDAVPIGHITNGVHVPSWLAPQMCRLYDRHLGVGWQQHSGRREDLGGDRERRRWRAVGDAPEPEVAAAGLRAPARVRAGGAARRSRRRLCSGWARCFRRMR